MSEYNKPISQWVSYCTNLINKKSKILDVACGSGRHTRFLIQKGHFVTGIDLNPKFELEGDYKENYKIIKYDLEKDAWPFETSCFDCILVTNYLLRPLFPFFICLGIEVVSISFFDLINIGLDK